jgi:glutaminase
MRKAGSIAPLPQLCCRRPDRGEVATYIPELARVDAKTFGLVVIDAEGNVAAGGDSETPFSIQSISKVFTLIRTNEVF